MCPDGVEPPVFAIDVTAGADGESAVSVAGELDLAKADEFADAMRHALSSGPVLLDLRELTFMDSAGVRALNAALREATESGRQLRVHPTMHPSVAQILELTGMMRLLKLAEDGQ